MAKIVFLIFWWTGLLVLILEDWLGQCMAVKKLGKVKIREGWSMDLLLGLNRNKSGESQRSEILAAFIQFVLDITQGLENIYTDRLNVREP